MVLVAKDINTLLRGPTTTGAEKKARRHHSEPTPPMGGAMRSVRRGASCSLSLGSGASGTSSHGPCGVSGRTTPQTVQASVDKRPRANSGRRHVVATSDDTVVGSRDICGRDRGQRAPGASAASSRTPTPQPVRSVGPFVDPQRRSASTPSMQRHRGSSSAAMRCWPTQPTAFVTDNRARRVASLDAADAREERRQTPGARPLVESSKGGGVFCRTDSVSAFAAAGNQRCGCTALEQTKASRQSVTPTNRQCSSSSCGTNPRRPRLSSAASRRLPAARRMDSSSTPDAPNMHCEEADDEEGNSSAGTSSLRTQTATTDNGVSSPAAIPPSNFNVCCSNSMAHPAAAGAMAVAMQLLMLPLPYRRGYPMPMVRSMPLFGRRRAASVGGGQLPHVAARDDDDDDDDEGALLVDAADGHCETNVAVHFSGGTCSSSSSDPPPPSTPSERVALAATTAVRTVSLQGAAVPSSWTVEPSSCRDDAAHCLRSMEDRPQSSDGCDRAPPSAAATVVLRTKIELEKREASASHDAAPPQQHHATRPLLLHGSTDTAVVAPPEQLPLAALPTSSSSKTGAVRRLPTSSADGSNCSTLEAAAYATTVKSSERAPSPSSAAGLMALLHRRGAGGSGDGTKLSAPISSRVAMRFQPPSEGSDATDGSAAGPPEARRAASTSPCIVPRRRHLSPPRPTDPTSTPRHGPTSSDCGGANLHRLPSRCDGGGSIRQATAPQPSIVEQPLQRAVRRAPPPTNDNATGRRCSSTAGGCGGAPSLPIRWSGGAVSAGGSGGGCWAHVASDARGVASDGVDPFLARLLALRCQQHGDQHRHDEPKGAWRSSSCCVAPARAQSAPPSPDYAAPLLNRQGAGGRSQSHKAAAAASDGAMGDHQGLELPRRRRDEVSLSPPRYATLRTTFRTTTPPRSPQYSDIDCCVSPCSPCTDNRDDDEIHPNAAAPPPAPPIGLMAVLSKRDQSSSYDCAAPAVTPSPVATECNATHNDNTTDSAGAGTAGTHQENMDPPYHMDTTSYSSSSPPLPGQRASTGHRWDAGGMSSGSGGTSTGQTPYVELLKKASRELHELRMQRDQLTHLVDRLTIAGRERGGGAIADAKRQQHVAKRLQM